MFLFSCTTVSGHRAPQVHHSKNNNLLNPNPADLDCGEERRQCEKLSPVASVFLEDVVSSRSVMPIAATSLAAAVPQGVSWKMKRRGQLFSFGTRGGQPREAEARVREDV